MRGEYSTRQKREMLAFLKAHDYEPLTVDELVFRLGAQGTTIGRTTAYRYLETLAGEGEVRKYQSIQGLTQYQHISDSAACSEHFHMMCRRCGRLYHVECEHMEELARHIASEHGFMLDVRETVLMGVCAQCGGKGEGEHGAAEA